MLHQIYLFISIIVLICVDTSKTHSLHALPTLCKSMHICSMCIKGKPVYFNFRVRHVFWT